MCIRDRQVFSPVMTAMGGERGSSGASRAAVVESGPRLYRPREEPLSFSTSPATWGNLHGRIDRRERSPAGVSGGADAPSLDVTAGAGRSAEARRGARRD